MTVITPRTSSTEQIESNEYSDFEEPSLSRETNGISGEQVKDESPIAGIAIRDVYNDTDHLQDLSQAFLDDHAIGNSSGKLFQHCWQSKKVCVFCY